MFFFVYRHCYAQHLLLLTHSFPTLRSAVLAHGGRYPVYGSHVMLMPDHCTGVFALANRTYAGPSTPAWDTAVAMDKAGLLKARSIPVSPTVADAYAAAKAA